MRPRDTVIVFAFAMLAAGPALAGDKRAGNKHAPAATQAACQSNADCALAVDGCCDCNAGGKMKAIPARLKAAAEQKRKKDCAGTMCPAVVSTDPSCAGTAVCRAGACAVATAREAPAPNRK